MKRILSTALAAVLLLSSLTFPTSGADWSGSAQFATLTNHSGKGSTRSYRYASSAADTYNAANIDIGGNVLSIRRSSYQLHDSPDQIYIQQAGVSQLQREAAWTTVPMGGNAYSYVQSIDVSGLANGTYTVRIESKSNYIYKMLEVDFVKDTAESYFPRDNSLSKQYNNGSLLRLDTSPPNDFADLVEEYGKGNGASVLSSIEAQSKELVRGKRTDREKALAIYRWIVDNIAYDVDISGEAYHSWVAKHPEDVVRLDNPLNAFTQKYALCYGFSKLTVLMMGYGGVDCVYITGCLADENTRNINNAIGSTAPEIMNHAWNAVKISGAWYYLDTSNDAINYYYRGVKESPGTGYTEQARAPIYLHTFASLNHLSKTHIALRMGAKNKGTKLTGASVTEGWQTENGSTVYYLDGTKVRKDWQKIDGEVYYFDAKGMPATGWQLLDDYWRYFDEDGKLATGSKKIKDGDDTRTYQFDSDGCLTASNAYVTFGGARRYFRGREMLTGWQFLQRSWRYFDDTGAMYQDAEKPLSTSEGKFTFNEQGALQLDGKGWVTFGGEKHYFDGDEIYTGIRTVGARDYLFDDSGVLLTGWQTYRDKTYFLTDGGELQTGWLYLDEHWYHIDRDQGMYTGPQQAGGTTHYFNAQGQLSTSGWVNVGEGFLYFADAKKKNGVMRDGTMVKGWKKVDGKLRFFDRETGIMHTGENRINENNGKWYSFDSVGEATQVPGQ